MHLVSVSDLSENINMLLLPPQHHITPPGNGTRGCKNFKAYHCGPAYWI